MKQNNSNLLYHLVAFITVAIWGTTFVSTKVLMLNGLSPAQIFTLRFSIAYILMLMVNHKRMFADSWKDEFKMAMLGITGGSLYFLSENEAMNYTTTTNTSLIVCSCPLVEWQIRAASVACRRCLGFYGMYELGCLFAPDEIGIGRLWRSFYYPQGLLLWCAYHLALLSYHSWVAGMGCVYEASGGG